MELFITCGEVVTIAVTCVIVGFCVRIVIRFVADILDDIL